jgi:hypothetical protein
MFSHGLQVIVCQDLMNALMTTKLREMMILQSNEDYFRVDSILTQNDLPLAGSAAVKISDLAIAVVRR